MVFLFPALELLGPQRFGATEEFLLTDGMFHVKLIQVQFDFNS
jgi:hypothetical protein